MNETTKQIPFKLLIRGLPSKHQRTDKSIEPDNDRQKRLLQIRTLAKEAITNAQALLENKRKTKYVPFAKNQQVWLEGTNIKTTHPTTKLAPKQYGPFTITKKISDVVYQIKLPTTWKIHNVFHTSFLTPHEETEIHGPNYQEPPPELIEGSPEYEVEQILKSRRVGKKKTLQYRVR
jgi:hypothetical protein